MLATSWRAESSISEKPSPSPPAIAPMSSVDHVAGHVLAHHEEHVAGRVAVHAEEHRGDDVVAVAHRVGDLLDRQQRDRGDAHLDRDRPVICERAVAAVPAPMLPISRRASSWAGPSTGGAHAALRAAAGDRAATSTISATEPSPRIVAPATPATSPRKPGRCLIDDVLLADEAVDDEAQARRRRARTTTTLDRAVAARRAAGAAERDRRSRSHTSGTTLSRSTMQGRPPTGRVSAGSTITVSSIASSGTAQT